MTVDRCICHNTTFERLKEHAARSGGSLAALADATGCTTKCGMCKPYIIQMLRTGRTIFPIISEPAARTIIAQWEHSQLTGQSQPA
jgi:bacterioferritin-associated ferredoxin